MTSDLSDSLWHATCRETVSVPALVGEIDADLAVIGGGYTGLSAALHGATEGASIALIEAGEIGCGGSGRNVGLVNAGLWLPPAQIIARLGEIAGMQLYRMLASAPDLVFDLIDRFDIACEPVRNGTLHCAHAPRGLRDLTDRHRQQSDLGAPVELLNREETVFRVGSEQLHGALFDPRAGTIQPLAYAKGLARAATQAGARIFEHSPAASVQQTEGVWRVETPTGAIRARALIVATNGYRQSFAGMPNQTIVPVQYFQSATDPLPADMRTGILPEKEGCWDTGLVMSSWRLDQDGRLVIGGMGSIDHPGRGAHLHWVQRKLGRLFPALAGSDLRQTWSGRIAMTSEYLPKILHIGRNALVPFGYSGRGIGPGTVFGQRIARALLSEDLSLLPVEPVTSHSLPFAGMRQSYYETGATLTHLVKDRF